MLALSLDYSTAALATSQKVSFIWKLVELKMLDFSNLTIPDISILTQALIDGLKSYQVLKGSVGLGFLRKTRKKYHHGPFLYSYLEMAPFSVSREIA